MVRYSAELQLQPSLLSPVLEFFVGPSGIHSTETHVQLRAWYLFERLLIKIQDKVSPMAEQVLGAFINLLQIDVTASSISTADSDSESTSEQDVVFDNQLFLFQSAGLLIASLQSTNFKAADGLLQSLTGTIDARVQLQAQDPVTILTVHHNIMALGDIAKGFDNSAIQSRRQFGHRLFSLPSDSILRALVTFQDSSSVRDAVRPDSRFLSDTLDSVCICAFSQCDGRIHSGKGA
jgi:exportin-T